MSIGELLAELSSRDIKVWAEGSSLRCSAQPGTLTPALRQALRDRKADVLDFLRDAAALARQAPLVVPLQAHGQRVPIFAVPGHNGDVFCYRALARHLGADQPFFALQLPGLDGLEAPLETVEDLATRLATEIHSSSPNGALILAGFCAGGTIAFETAKKLREKGREILLLALLGSPYPSFFRSSWARIVEIIRFQLNELASLGLTGKIGYIVDKVRKRSSLRTDVMIMHRRSVEMSTVRAMKSYFPVAFPCRIRAFLPSCPNADRQTPRWGEMSRDFKEFLGPDCTEANMLTEPNAMFFGRLLRQAIDEVRAGSELDVGRCRETHARFAAPA